MTFLRSFVDVGVFNVVFKIDHTNFAFVVGLSIEVRVRFKW